MKFFSRPGLCFAALCIHALLVPRLSLADLLPPGFRPQPLGVHALVGGKVVVKPGETIEPCNIVIRDGRIVAVGKDAAVPADARVWDMKSNTIYAGFIDCYLALDTTNAPVSTSGSEPITSGGTFTSPGVKFFGTPGAQTDPGNPGPGYEISRITPEYQAVKDYSPKEKSLEPLREIGFTAGVIAPGRGIIRGTSSLVTLNEENPNDVVLKPEVFQHIAFESGSREDGSYPSSLMGSIAVIRQSFFDTRHYIDDLADYAKNSQNRKRPEFNQALQALEPALEKKIRVAIEPGSALMASRAGQLGRELQLDYCIVSSGQEWRRPDLAKAVAASFIVPLNFPTLPKLPSEDDWDQVTLDQLRAWDWAPENPAVLRKQGLEIALTTYGLSDKKKFRQNLRLALDRGLSETDALAALTTTPAKLCGVESQVGTIEAGKLANLTVVSDKGYFDPEGKVREVWIDGRIYRAPADEPGPGKGDATAPAKPVSPEEGAPNRPQPGSEKSEKKAPTASEKKGAATTPSKPEEKKPAKKEQLRELQKTRTASSPTDGRGPAASPPALLIRNTTLWTCTDKGILTNSDLLIAGGKIQQVGNIKADLDPATLIIDGKEMNVTPGIIDCHNHSMILGAVNEGTIPSSAMVRIHDVVNSETEHIYEQLAGGVTAANLLHGSANPIGGQNCVIKLKDGASPEDLVFDAAPQGIKFALGENVKQANWGDRFVTRFPQTRMGVRTFIANRFTAAQQYLAENDIYRQKGGIAPRRDLELEALGEIIQGKRVIHCHSYRQDEILMLIRLMESFGVKIGTFQHVLEGYKVADEIAKHGAGGSTFSDWWAYKFEVYDAIAYNGSLMRDRGVVVSFNSDSSELARRLYAEAAKAVKYGNTPETEALKFVTLNPARQLHIDQRVGTLEPGKDGDIAVWSKSPLDSETLCLQTWIEGKKYFDRTLEKERANRLEKERNELIEKAKKISKLAGGGGRDGGTDESEQAFFTRSLEHEFDGIDRGCLDE